MNEKKDLYIFLDIDGVLNNYKEYGNDNYGYDLNINNIKYYLMFIKEISKKYNIQTILSSDWKYSDTYDIALMTYGINIIDTTFLTLQNLDNAFGIKLEKANFEKLREEEIRLYLKENKKIKNYIIIDDMNLQINNFYKTNPMNGFTEKDISLIINKIEKN